MMSLSAAGKATAQNESTIWREIRARLSANGTKTQWLPARHRRIQRRLYRLLMAELLRDHKLA
jgi:hypothetical protein